MLDMEASELRKLDGTFNELKREEETFIRYVRDLNEYLLRPDCSFGLQGFVNMDRIVSPDKHAF